MPKKINLEEVDEVTSWLSLPQVAEKLKLSRQQVHRMAAGGKFETLSRIGTFLVVFYEEVDEIFLARGLDTGESVN